MVKRFMLAGVVVLSLTGQAHAGQELDRASLILSQGLTVHDASIIVSAVIGSTAFSDKMATCGTQPGVIPWQCRAIYYQDADEVLVLAFTRRPDGVWSLQNWATVPKQ